MNKRKIIPLNRLKKSNLSLRLFWIQISQPHPILSPSPPLQEKIKDKTKTEEVKQPTDRPQKDYVLEIYTGWTNTF